MASTKQHPISMVKVNDFHFDRYNDFHSRTGGGSIGKPVVPIFKYSHYDDPSKYLDSMRGMDDRNKSQTLRSIAQKLRDTTEIRQRQN
mgnify:CR=1 FL=1